MGTEGWDTQPYSCFIQDCTLAAQGGHRVPGLVGAAMGLQKTSVGWCMPLSSSSPYMSRQKRPFFFCFFPSSLCAGGATGGAPWLTAAGGGPPWPTMGSLAAAWSAVVSLAGVTLRGEPPAVGRAGAAALPAAAPRPSPPGRPAATPWAQNSKGSLARGGSLFASSATSSSSCLPSSCFCTQGEHEQQAAQQIRAETQACACGWRPELAYVIPDPGWHTQCAELKYVVCQAEPWRSH